MMKVSLSNIRKWYGSSCVLDIPSLELDEGKITGFFGYNGAGKSTLLSIIAGLDSLHEGEIMYDGVQRNPQTDTQITCVFQRPQMLRRSVRSNIAYPLKLRGVGRNERYAIADSIMEDLGIAKLSRRHAWQLSGGEQQKVALARALVLQPKLLLLDEASASMDRPSVKLFEKEICSFCDRTGSAVSIVTHSLSQVERLCDRIIYLDRGRMSTRDEVL